MNTLPMVVLLFALSASLSPAATLDRNTFERLCISAAQTAERDDVRQLTQALSKTGFLRNTLFSSVTEFLGNEGAVLEQNRKLVSFFFDSMNKGDVNAAFSIISGDVRWWVPGTLPFSGTKSKAEYLKIVAQIRAGFPAGITFTVRHTTAEGSRVAAEVESEGLHVNGRRYANRYHFTFVFQADQVVEVKEYMDTLHLHDLIAPVGILTK